MCRRQIIHIVGLTARCGLALKVVPVPTGGANLIRMAVTARHAPAPGQGLFRQQVQLVFRNAGFR